MKHRYYDPGVRAVRVEVTLAWIANLSAVLLLPAKLGLSSASIGAFLAYCLVCGIALTLGEDWRYARTLFVRADVRGYLVGRIAMVVAAATLPYLIGRIAVG